MDRQLVRLPRFNGGICETALSQIEPYFLGCMIVNGLRSNGSWDI